MNQQLRLAKTEPASTGAASQTPTGRKRNLGGAIFLAAIDDYRSTDQETHEDAAAFLYPRTRKWQRQYDWALGLTEGINPGWLRDQLDGAKARWDGERFDEIVCEMRRKAV